MLKRLIIFIFSMLFWSCIAFGQVPNYSFQTNTSIKISQLEQGFANPPAESRLRTYWWWLNSMATKESITRDLEEMKAKGYGGAILFDGGRSKAQETRKTPAGPAFLSPGWMELYKHAVKEADRLGIELSVNIQSGWNPGGPMITPEFALKKVVWSEVDVNGGSMISIELPQPEEKLMYEDVLVQAIPKKEGTMVKDEAIQNWTKKTLTERMGWKGIYPLNELREDFSGDGSELAVRKDEIIDLTENYKNGKLEWNAPEGNWTILRYGYTCTGAHTSTYSDGWGGLSLDFLNPEAFELYSETVIIPLVETAQSAGNSVQFLFSDSWEMGVVNWTNRFPEEFKKFRGYDIKKYMPILAGRIVENRDETNRFLHDFRKTVSDCIIEYHYKLFSDLAHSYGLGIHPESGGPHAAPIDALRVMGISDIPQGEFWAKSNTHRTSDGDRLAVKQAASAAHTNGKRFVAAEGQTAIGPQWERSPKDMKGNIDRVFGSGVNRIIWQIFSSSPEEFGLPGNVYSNGTHLEPNVTWWEQAKDFISYLNRSSFMLQQGLFVADVLYYYGDDVPNFVFLKEEYPELKFGYNWDKCSKDVILDRVSFENGKIRLPDGMSYHVLVLTPEKAIDLEVLKKVESLVNAGMTVVSPRPEGVTGLTAFPKKNNRELKAIADRLWGKIDGESILENKVGKGRVIWGRDINEVLAEMNVKPRFGFKSNREETALEYIHRSTDTEEIFFVTNRFARKGINDFEYRYLTDLPDRYEDVECTFRVSGKIPHLWDPKTGEMREILVYQEENGKITIPFHFEPEGSVFVVFTEGKAENHIVKIEKDAKSIFPGNVFEAKEHPYVQFSQTKGQWAVTPFETGNYTIYWSNGEVESLQAYEEVQPIPLKGSWEVHFDPEWGGPETIVFDELKSWTDFSDDGIKYYSGSAVYKKSFTMEKEKVKGKKVLLNLGNLHEMAVVTLNGHEFRVNWAPPFEVDITDHLLDGENRLEVEITNLWPNRLIGDGKLSNEEDRFTKTNIVKFDAPDAEKYLRVSGLLGPVNLQLLQMYELKQKQ